MANADGKTRDRKLHKKILPPGTSEYQVYSCYSFLNPKYSLFPVFLSFMGNRLTGF